MDSLLFDTIFVSPNWLKNAQFRFERNFLHYITIYLFAILISYVFNTIRRKAEDRKWRKASSFIDNENLIVSMTTKIVLSSATRY